MLSIEEQILEGAPRLRAFIGRRVQSINDADDLVQETLLKALRGSDSLRDRTRLDAWLYRVARRTIIDYYSGRQLREELRDTPAIKSDTHLARVTESVTRSALCYLANLPDEYRIVVQLADYEGLPPAEVAERLGISLSATNPACSAAGSESAS